MNPLVWIKAITDLVVVPIKGWNDRRTAKVEGKIALDKAVNNAKIQLANRGQLHEIDMEGKLLDAAGWKDEFWTIVISIPLIMCFIPGLDGYVYEGFEVLSGTPEWYQYICGVVIGAPFGVRTLGKMVTEYRVKKAPILPPKDHPILADMGTD